MQAFPRQVSVACNAGLRMPALASYVSNVGRSKDCVPHQCSGHHIFKENSTLQLPTRQENFALVNVIHDILNLATGVGGEEQSCGRG